MADWDSFANDYDDIFLENPVYLETLECMVAQLDPRDGMEVLDLGCGTGNATVALLERIPGARVTAMDPSRGMREKCAARFAGDGRVTVKAGDALGIDAADGQYDAVISNLAIHHVTPGERARAAAELARVLKPGGALLYSDMFLDVDSTGKDPERAKDLIDKQVGLAEFCLDHGAFDMAVILLKTLPADMCEDGEYKTTTGVWESLLEQAAFSVLRVIDIDFGMRIIVAEKL